MVTLVPEVAEPVEVDPAASGRRPRPRRWDGAAPLVYLAGGLYLTAHLWVAPGVRIETDNVQDQGFFEYVLAHAARVLVHPANPLFDRQINVPAGVNLMTNTSILGLAVPLAPVTLVAGPVVAYALLVTLGPALTAFTWYLVLSRHVTGSRLAAFVGGAFCGFAPGIVSQSNGHPNLAAQFLVPLILVQVVRLCTGARPVRTGVVLGLLVVWQAFVNEEVLLFVALIGALLALGYATTRWADLRPVLPAALRGLGVAVAVAGVALAYPLWFQFSGPQHYGSVPALWLTQHSDAASYVSYATRSLAGAPPEQLGILGHRAEENTYFGWPLLILAAMIAAWQWRRPLVRAATVVAVVFGLLSLGPTITVYGTNTPIPGPLRLLDHLPLLNAVVPGRFALMVIPALGVLLATGLDQLMAGQVTARPVWVAAFLGALVPLLPTPLPAIDGPRIPAFVASGEWRHYVPAGRSAVVVPVPTFLHIDGMRWSATQGLDMAIPGGYFLGPGPGGRALYGAPPRPSATLLDEVARTGTVPAVTDAERADMATDLRYWRAAVVLVGDVPHATQLRDTVTDLLGTGPERLDGAWIWDVRATVG